MNYNELNDYELVSLAQEKNEEAINLLHKKYQPLIYKKCKKIYSYVPQKGIELADLIQECLIGFEEAIANFDEKDEVTFYTFCNLCMDRQLRSEVTKLNREKHKILNEAIPFEYIDNEGDIKNIVDFLVSDEKNPETDILNQENTQELILKIKTYLTDFEESVFDLRLQDFDYREIASILDKPPKAIDNALQRIKTKIKKILNLNN